MGTSVFLSGIFPFLQLEKYDFNKFKGFLYLKNPNLPGFEKRINLIARILQVPAGSQNVKGLLIFFTFISGL